MLRVLSRPSERIDRAEALFELASNRPLFPSAALSDIGDISHVLHQRDDKSYLDFITQAVHILGKEGKKPLLLGGDHLVTLSSLRGLAKAGRKFQVVQIDAHHDFASTTAPVLATHGTFMSFVAKEELAEQVLQIGVRGWSSSPAVHPAGIKTIALEELGDALLPNVDVYLTVDTDGFDPAFMPAVSYPIPGGLPFGALSKVLTTIASRGNALMGGDWMEYNPRFDTENHVTGEHVIAGLIELIAGLLRA